VIGEPFSIGGSFHSSAGRPNEAFRLHIQSTRVCEALQCVVSMIVLEGYLDRKANRDRIQPDDCVWQGKVSVS
jgi:hypothetical protein